MTRWDLIVVGAGVLGVFHAYWAARAGMRVLLVERNDWPRDASARNFGMVIPSGMEPGLWHERALVSIHVYEELVWALPLQGVRRGTTYLASNALEAAVLEEFARLGPSLGYRCELQESAQAARVNPAIREDACQAALHFPDDIVLDPVALLRALIPWLCERHGITYRDQTRVIAVDRGRATCLVHFASGHEEQSARVVICPGADMSTLFPEVFVNAGVSFTKLQMMRTVAQPRTLTTALATGWTIRRYGSFALAPSHARLREELVPDAIDRYGIHVLMKQDAGGAVTIGDSHQEPPAEAALSPELNMAIDEAILEQARRAVSLPT